MKRWVFHEGQLQAAIEAYRRELLQSTDENSVNQTIDSILWFMDLIRLGTGYWSFNALSLKASIESLTVRTSIPIESAEIMAFLISQECEDHKLCREYPDAAGN